MATLNARHTAPRQAIRAGQLASLRRLLAEIAPTNRFYGPILRETGLDRGVADLEEFAVRMPLTTKAAIVADQHQHPPYGTNLTYPLERYSRFNQTSATTGVPLRWLDTRESWQWMLDNWKQVFEAAGVDARDCVYLAFSFGPFLGFWTAMEAAAQLGCLSIPGGGLSSAARLEAMRANRATILCCTPTYALRLAEVAAEEKIDLAEFHVRKIIVAGEPGGSVPAIRQAIQSRWTTAAVFDHHGMTEVGPVSYQCPERPGTLMVMESSYLAEIIDPETGRAVEPGQVGELVLTTLGRIGSPLLRYRTGDLVCEDLEIAARFGRHELALAGGILGRVDDMLVVRGVNVYPAAVEEVVRSCAGVAEFRCHVSRRRAMTELQIEIEPLPGVDGPAAAHELERRIQSRFSLRAEVRLCPPAALPRFEMKARRWVLTCENSP
jgi:phenylacetate-CoA ligase